MGVKAMLSGQDVSDREVRAFVIDISIIPLFHRINGLYTKHIIPSVVIVGGVGN